MQTNIPSSSLPATLDYATRKVRRGWSSLSNLPLKANLASWLYKWCAAFRSFRAHIRIQFATMGAWVDAGEALQFQDGRYQPNERTYARAEGIKTLLANHPWADNADLQMFLMGFDAGEKYSTSGRGLPNSQDIPHNQMPQSP